MMKLIQILKGERQSAGEITAAIAELEGKLSAYQEEKERTEVRLQDLQEMAIMGEPVKQADLNKLTSQVEDLGQKAKAAQSTLRKLEGKKAEAVRREGQERLTKIQAELEGLQKEQRAATLDLVKVLAMVAVQLERAQGLPVEKWGRQVEGRHWRELASTVQTNKDLFFEEVAKLERSNLAHLIKLLQQEREGLLAEQKVKALLAA
jgi:chromosome segregation ATPase